MASACDADSAEKECGGPGRLLAYVGAPRGALHRGVADIYTSFFDNTDVRSMLMVLLAFQRYQFTCDPPVSAAVAAPDTLSDQLQHNPPYSFAMRIDVSTTGN